jgi:hypothetical protein
VNQILELSDKDSKMIIIKMIQQLIMNSPEGNGNYKKNQMKIIGLRNSTAKSKTCWMESTVECR